MTVQTHGLGGRIPLLEPGDLSAAQRKVYDLMNETMVPWANKSGFEAQTADGKNRGRQPSRLRSPADLQQFQRAAAIRDLAAGVPAHELSQEEQLAQRFTQALTARHQIDDDLYTAAEAAFGVQGIVDITYLAGCYDTISSLLNTLRVPAPGKNG